MGTFTRRGFVARSMASAAMTPLLLGAANASAQTNPDPYSYVDPELAAALRKFPAGPAVNAANLAGLRAGDKNYSMSDTPALRPRKATVPGPGGQVPVLIFDPRPGATNRPATIYIHGGGYVVGRADTNIQLAQDIAQGTGSMVVSVDYMLAPEAHFPKSLEQNYAALAWLHKSAGQFGVDPARLAVMGDSAGGGHAAMLAIAARDRREIPVAFQCLIYPMLDDRTGSNRRVPPYMGHFIWTEAENRFGWTSLLGQPAGFTNRAAGFGSRPRGGCERTSAHLHRRGLDRPLLRGGHRICPPPDPYGREHRVDGGARRLSWLRCGGARRQTLGRIPQCLAGGAASWA